MTEQGFSELAGKKVSNLLPTLSLSKHYTTPLPQICPPPTKNPTPSSSRESLKHFKNTDSVFPKAGFDKIGYASQSLIIGNAKATFKGKSKGVRALGGDSESLPRLMGRGFEGDQTTLPLASEIGVKMLLKAFGNEGLRNMRTDREWRK